MARRIVDEEMRFSIIVNGDPAQKELLDLEKANRKLLADNRKNRTEMRKLEKQKRTNTARYRELTREVDRNSSELRKNYDRMNALENEIGITNLTMSQLQNKLKALNIAFRNGGGAIYAKQIREVKAQMAKLRLETQASKSSLTRLADGFNRYSALIGGFALIVTGVVFQIQKLIDFNGKLSDALSDVRKTTGMTKEEVDDLAKSFGTLNTRTNRINLLKIAEEGGRIGIVKEEIGEFVEVMNKAVVALGDSFPGGAEETASKLGKLKVLFKETKELGVAEAYNAIGSAINELGADGLATEVNIANFATRVGSMPDAIKPTISEALALGAAFEESGIQAEISARAYNIFLRQASTETEKFGQVMGISAKEVEKLINDDPLEFMIKFAQGMKGMNATDTAKTLDYLGVAADGSNKVLGAMANNTDLFRSRLKLSNDEMEKGTSLIDEYNIKNNNFAATIDKIGKKLRGIFVSDVIVENLTKAVNWVAKLIGATDDATGAAARFREKLAFIARVLAVVIAAMLSYNIALRIQALLTKGAWRATATYAAVQKALTLAQKAGTAAMYLMQAAFYLLTGRITKAREAMIFFNIVTNANPYVLLVTAIGAIATALVVFSKEAKKATTAASLLNDSIHKSKEFAADTKAEIKALQGVVEDETISEQQRIKAIERLNEIVPDYNTNVDLSSEALKRGKEKIDAYIVALKEQARAEYLVSRIKETARKLEEERNKGVKESLTWADRWSLSLAEIFGDTSAMQENYTFLADKEKNKRLSILEEELDAAEKAFQAYNSSQLGPRESDPPSFNFGTTPFDQSDKDDPVSAYQKNLDKLEAERLAKEAAARRIALAKEAAARRIALAKETAREKLRINKELSDQERAEAEARISLIGDDFLREMALASEQHKQKIQNLKSQLIEKENLSEEEIAINGSIRRQILLQEDIFKNEQGKIIEDGYAEDLDELKATFDKEKALRAVRHQEEINALGTDQAAIKAKKEVHRKENLDAEIAHTQQAIDYINRLIASEEFEGFDLELLTPEQVTAMVELLGTLGVALDDIKAKKDAITCDGDFTTESAAAFGSGQADNVDVLGFTIEQWETSFANFDTLYDKLESVGMAIGAFANAWDTYNNFVTQSDRRRLENLRNTNAQEKDNLDRKLAANLINQRQYNQAVQASDLKLKKEQAEMEYKQAKRDRVSQIAAITSNTAIAVSKAWAASPTTLGMPWAGIIAGLGLAQIAMIMATPLPVKGFEQGFRVQREQDGKLFNARYGGESRSGVVDFPTVFMAGENRPEMIINGTDWAGFSPSLKGAIDRQLRMPGYQDGYYQNDTAAREMREGDGSDTRVTDTSSSFAIAQALNRNSEVMERLEESGIIAYIADDMESARRMSERISDFEKYRNQNRR